MRALALGCGEMGKVAIKDLVKYGEFDEVIIGDLDVKKAKRIAKELRGDETIVSTKLVDVTNSKKLIDLMSGVDVAISCVGPFYKFALPIVKAAIKAKVNFVDICDDYEVTTKVLELDSDAKDAGITVISGLGVSPGATNILAKAASEMLDEPEEVHISILMGASDLGGFAARMHIFRSMLGKVPTFQNGKYVKVQAFVDGRETVEFPKPFGKFEVYHIGHPEPLTIPRYIKKVRHVDTKCAINPPAIKDLIVSLGELGFASEDSLNIKGLSITPLEFAASYVHKMGCKIKNVPKMGAIRVEVRGMKGGNRTNVAFASTGRMDEGTGVQVSIGAQLLARGEIKEKGVFAPEGCINAQMFISEYMKREPKSPVEMFECTTTNL